MKAKVKKVILITLLVLFMFVAAIIILLPSILGRTYHHEKTEFSNDDIKLIAEKF